MKTEQITENTISDLARLAVEMWPDSSYEVELQDAQDIFHSNRKTAFLLRDAEGYQGFIMVFLRYDFVEGTATSPVGYIEGIYLRAAFRRQGYAARLLQEAENWARDQGCTEMGSDTEITNQVSIHFHKKMGFGEVNRVVCFYKKLKSQ